MPHSIQKNTLTLIADIGGTYARFARIEPAAGCEAILDMRRYETATTTFQAAVQDFIFDKWGEIPDGTQLDLRVAVAAPVLPAQVNGTHPVHLTNNPWVIGGAVLGDTFPNARLTVLNDFAAVALSLPHLRMDELTIFAAGTPQEDALTKIAIGPGTGLGVATIVPSGKHWQALPGEGGHITLAATTAREYAIIALVQQRYAHVSAERLLSGTGLPLLHEAVCSVDGLSSDARTAPEISDAAAVNEPAAQKTLQTFATMLGSVAGNAALTVGALGGVYLAGGLIQRWQTLFPVDAFMRAFIAKGRFQGYLERVPVYRIDVAEPGLVGLARGLSLVHIA
jgi:glucokinase